MSTMKRKDNFDASGTPKRAKKDCTYGEKCFRKNPTHFREFSHSHLEKILDEYSGEGSYQIPSHLFLEREMIREQLDILVEKSIYIPKSKFEENNLNASSDDVNKPAESVDKLKETVEIPSSSIDKKEINIDQIKNKSPLPKAMEASTSTNKDSNYCPMVQPTRKIQDYIKVVAPRGVMAEKHAKSAPYHIFYTTITSAKETHNQPNSITFQEILDLSLGELKCSLQINFMVEIGWLLGQYYFAGYSNKKLTILYGEDCPDLRAINKKRPNVDAHLVSMATPFGKHHTKMMVLCYEDGSVRVVISTANLYTDDWENRTQGLWMSPKCPELPESAMPHEGESPTGFKKSLLKYLNHYHMPQLSFYVDRVKRCDFTDINVFLVASVPGGHFDFEWGLMRIGSLLRQHCKVPPDENHKWDLIAQASSIGSYGKEPKLWLTGDFHHNFCKIQNQSQLLSGNFSKLKIVYPSLENVRQSHDGLLGGGCLPYAATAHSKQTWLNDFLYQWKAHSSCRDRAMPHVKSYTRLSADGRRVPFYLLTSANVSKAAWGVVNKGNGALRVMSYEAGVLLLPSYVIKKDWFSIDKTEEHCLSIPYDLPPTKYTADMSPWVSDYLQ